MLLVFMGCESPGSSETDLSNSVLEIGTISLSESEIKTHSANLRENYQPRDGEMHFHKIADEVPEFGGYYVNENGDLVVYVKEGGNTEMSRSLAVDQLRELRIPEFLETELSSVVIKEADFHFEELAFWRELVFEFVLGSDTFDYVSAIQVDESKNRIVIDIDEERYSEQNVNILKSFLFERLDIPADAVAFNKSSPIVPLHEENYNNLYMNSLSGTLSQHNRPLVGGLRIRNQEQTGSNDGCTAGFIADVFTKRWMITNSHCTVALFYNDEGYFYQPSNTFTTFGRVYKDPSPWVCGFNQFCRNSDAAAIEIFDGQDYNIGQIARTEWLNNTGGSGSTTIDSSSPVFSIVEDGNFSIQGTNVEKVGRTTGWTGGNIVGTCIDTVMSPPNYKLICQHHADLHADGQDSGSPVFQRLDSIHVRLVGLLWGRQSGTNIIYFSRMSGIRRFG